MTVPTGPPASAPGPGPGSPGPYPGYPAYPGYPGYDAAYPGHPGYPAYGYAGQAPPTATGPHRAPNPNLTPNPYAAPVPPAQPPPPGRTTGQGMVLLVRVLGLALALSLVGFGAVGVISQFFRQRAVESTVVAGPVRQLVTDTDVGDVWVHEGAPGQPMVVRRTLTWSFHRPSVSVTNSGGTVSIAAHCSSDLTLGNCSVALDITLPPGTSVRISSMTGDVDADGLSGTIKAATSNGDVRLRGLRSKQVTATSSTGDVLLSLLTDPQAVQARTSTGDVLVNVPADGTTYQVTARTSVGERRVRIPTDPASTRTITASTSVGDLTLDLTP